MADEFISMSRVFQNGDTISTIINLEFQGGRFVIKNQFSKLNKQGAIKSKAFQAKKKEKVLEKAKEFQQARLDSFSNVEVKEEGF